MKKSYWKGGRAIVGSFSMVALTAGLAAAADVTIEPWIPIFVGVELTSGRQAASLPGERNHRVMCLRVDLSNPDVKLFTTPKCANCGTYETLAQTPSGFLEQHKLQASVNGAFYSSSTGPNDVPEGTPEDVLGLAMSEGVVVSPGGGSGNAATMLFTEDNRAFYVPTNSPPTNTTGLFTAISGNRPLLINGVNVNNPIPNDLDPRTAVGLSRDRRYLYLMTLDGRQPGWSDGADWYNTGEWLLRFGAWDGINVDGGGSTTMVMEGCGGTALRLNRSSFVAAYGRERIIGHNFGVRAPRLPSEIEHAEVTPGTTTAIITWNTTFAGNTRVDYGLTTSYGTTLPIDPQPVNHHVVTLRGLLPGTSYYFKVTSQGVDGPTYTDECRFATGNNISTTELFGLTQEWRYTTNNLDGVGWKARAYNDTNWFGPGAGLLYVSETNPQVSPRNTEMPVLFGNRTYYFRTHFEFLGGTAGASLTFSNYIDDGAVFYLNGAEIQRVRMPAAPQTINNATTAIGVPCTGSFQSGDALTTCPDVFTIAGNLVANNLVEGDNVVAVELHNSTTGSDLVFGGALLRSVSTVEQPTLHLITEGDLLTFYWNGEGFTLQESTDLGSPANWTDVAGPVTTSPHRVTRGATTFYRLRN